MKSVFVNQQVPWLLDFDEDYVSCSNPFQEELKAFLGSPFYNVLKRTYDPVVDAAAHWDQLRVLLARGVFKEDVERYKQAPIIKKLMRNTPLPLLLQFRDVCQRLFRRTNGKLTMKDVFPMGLMHAAGESCGLPHHISTAEEIAIVLNTTENLLTELADPLLVTVATSRADRYLPETQADVIHRLVTQILSKQYHGESQMGQEKHKRGLIAVAGEQPRVGRSLKKAKTLQDGYNALMYGKQGKLALLATIGDGVHVAPSTIRGAGLGLFASRAFATRSYITGYHGELIDKKIARLCVERGVGTHIISRHHGLDALDGLETPATRGIAAGSFVNHHPTSPNSEFILTGPNINNPPTIKVLQATCPISEGQEIFVSYGKDYWKLPHARDDKVPHRSQRVFLDT